MIISTFSSPEISTFFNVETMASTVFRIIRLTKGLRGTFSPFTWMVISSSSKVFLHQIREFPYVFFDVEVGSFRFYKISAGKFSG